MQLRNNISITNEALYKYQVRCNFMIVNMLFEQPWCLKLVKGIQFMLIAKPSILTYNDNFDNDLNAFIIHIYLPPHYYFK